MEDDYLLDECPEFEESDLQDLNDTDSWLGIEVGTTSETESEEDDLEPWEDSNSDIESDENEFSASIPTEVERTPDFQETSKTDNITYPWDKPKPSSNPISFGGRCDCAGTCTGNCKGVCHNSCYNSCLGRYSS